MLDLWRQFSCSEFESVKSTSEKDCFPSSSHAGRQRGIVLPPEFDLARFASDVDLREALTKCDTATPACEWPGVQCNDEGEVSIIDWTTCNLRGSLHWEYLPSTLEALVLGFNSLSGTVNFVCLPPQLNLLDLGNNKFSGEIAFEKLPRTMKTLFLSFNRFSGEVDFSGLPDQIEAVYLTANSFLTGTVQISSLPPSLKPGYRSWKGTKICEI